MATNTRPVPLSAKRATTPLTSPFSPTKAEKETPLRSPVPHAIQRQIHFQTRTANACRQCGRLRSQRHDLHRRKGRGFPAYATGSAGCRPLWPRTYIPDKPLHLPSPVKAEMPREAQGGGQQGRRRWHGRCRRLDTSPRWWHRRSHRHSRPPHQVQVVDPRGIGSDARRHRGNFSCEGKMPWAPAVPGQPDGAVGSFPLSSTAERGTAPVSSRQVASAHGYSTPPVGNTTLLAILRDELFAIESEKVSGTITAEEYNEVKAGLEAVLRRRLGEKEVTSWLSSLGAADFAVTYRRHRKPGGSIGSRGSIPLSRPAAGCGLQWSLDWDWLRIRPRVTVETIHDYISGPKTTDALGYN